MSRKLGIIFLPVVIGLFAATSVSADPFADRVVNFTQGAGGGFNSMYLPGVVLGAPQGGSAFYGSTDVLSLGLGGSITLEFTDNQIENGAGPDLTVFENAFLYGDPIRPPFAEPATVAVSNDGTDFRAFPCESSNAPYYPDCAGVYPTFANAAVAGTPSATIPTTIPLSSLVGGSRSTFVQPSGSGGNSFDLASVGLANARFVRITSGSTAAGGSGTSGFDLDAVVAADHVPMLSPTTTQPEPNRQPEPSVVQAGSGVTGSTPTTNQSVPVTTAGPVTQPVVNRCSGLKSAKLVLCKASIRCQVQSAPRRRKECLKKANARYKCARKKSASARKLCAERSRRR